jgi:hypothetical protein
MSLKLGYRNRLTGEIIASFGQFIKGTFLLLFFMKLHPSVAECMKYLGSLGVTIFAISGSKNRASRWGGKVRLANMR